MQTKKYDASIFRGLIVVAACFFCSCGGGLGRPPKGGEIKLSAEQEAAIVRVRGAVSGWITWSSSRFGNHDIFTMKTDGTEVKRLTQGDHVDWYPRFSADGKQILFTRSKRGWVAEREANRLEKWDLMLMDREGSGMKRVVENASWGIWIGPQKILFSRGTKVLIKDLATGAETLLVDSTQVEGLGGAELQNPQLSPDGRFLALTLRGSRRETGIFTLAEDRWVKPDPQAGISWTPLTVAKNVWVKTGEGCQINWFPAGDRVLWINPSGNGGSETLSIPVKEGRPTREFSYAEMRFIDIPGRRSHEYFPQLDRRGQWMVWAATRRGHDHDIADYEIYIWKVGAPPEHAARLTFNSGNDRWPDIFIP